MENMSGYITVRSLEESHQVISLLKREEGCLKCDDSKKLGCPAECPNNCQYFVPSADCIKECPKSFCIESSPDNQTDGGETSSGGGPSAGAIAGGVIGGIVFIIITTYLVWRFLIRPKRSQMPPSVFETNPSTTTGDLEKDTASRLTRRSSTHTVHSIASTVLTRASNIIQIAYIPGVTNRATPSSPTVLVPPVPPIPMHHADGNRESELEDQHFFVPGDLVRDSTYSGLSGYSERTSYARTSYAPRSSVASTIYGKQAHVVNPAQTFMRAKPTVVSVKSMMNNNSSASSMAGSTPPVPNIDYDKFARPKSRDSTFSVGSTFLNNANTATSVRAQVVKVGTGLKKEGSKSDISVVSSTANSLPPPSPETSTAYSVRDSNISSTIIDDSPTVDQGPFSDPPERPHPVGANGNSSTLGAVMEEDGEHGRAVDRNSRRLGSTERGSSPFSDDHATRD